MDADSPAEPESLLQEMAPAEDQNLLDPATTERKIYRTGGVPREIWRPGKSAITAFSCCDSSC